LNTKQPRVVINVDDISIAIFIVNFGVPDGLDLRRN
jgi:hypothetical protein